MPNLNSRNSEDQVSSPVSSIVNRKKAEQRTGQYRGIRYTHFVAVQFESKDIRFISRTHRDRRQKFFRGRRCGRLPRRPRNSNLAGKFSFAALVRKPRAAYLSRAQHPSLHRLRTRYWLVPSLLSRSRLWGGEGGGREEQWPGSPRRNNFLPASHVIGDLFRPTQIIVSCIAEGASGWRLALVRVYASEAIIHRGYCASLLDCLCTFSAPYSATRCLMCDDRISNRRKRTKYSDK